MNEFSDVEKRWKNFIQYYRENSIYCVPGKKKPVKVETRNLLTSSEML